MRPLPDPFGHGLSVSDTIIFGLFKSTAEEGLRWNGLSLSTVIHSIFISIQQLYGEVLILIRDGGIGTRAIGHCPTQRRCSARMQRDLKNTPAFLGTSVVFPLASAGSGARRTVHTYQYASYIGERPGLLNRPHELYMTSGINPTSVLGVAVLTLWLSMAPADGAARRPGHRRSP